MDPSINQETITSKLNLLNQSIKFEKFQELCFRSWIHQFNSSNSILNSWLNSQSYEPEFSNLLTIISNLLSNCSKAQNNYANGLSDFRAYLKDLNDRELNLQITLKAKHDILKRLVKLNNKSQIIASEDLKFKIKHQDTKRELRSIEHYFELESNSLNHLKQHGLRLALKSKLESFNKLGQIIQSNTQQAIDLLTQFETEQNAIFHDPSNDDYNVVMDSLDPPYTTHPSFSTQTRTQQLYHDPSPQNHIPLNPSSSIRSSSHRLCPNLSSSTNSNSHRLGPNLSSSTNSNSHCLGPNLSSSTNSNTHRLNPNLSSDHHPTRPTSLAHSHSKRKLSKTANRLSRSRPSDGEERCPTLTNSQPSHQSSYRTSYQRFNSRRYSGQDQDVLFHSNQNQGHQITKQPSHLVVIPKPYRKHHQPLGSLRFFSRGIMTMIENFGNKKRQRNIEKKLNEYWHQRKMRSRSLMGLQAFRSNDKSKPHNTELSSPSVWPTMNRLSVVSDQSSQEDQPVNPPRQLRRTTVMNFSNSYETDEEQTNELNSVPDQLQTFNRNLRETTEERKFGNSSKRPMSTSMQSNHSNASINFEKLKAKSSDNIIENETVKPKSPLRASLQLFKIEEQESGSDDQTKRPSTPPSLIEAMDYHSIISHDDQVRRSESSLASDYLEAKEAMNNLNERLKG